MTHAEMAMAAINAGAYAVTSWSFCDYPDPFPVEDSHDPTKRAIYESGRTLYKPDLKYNKWGVFRWSDARGDYTANPTYFTLGMMSRYFRKGATVLRARTDDPELTVSVPAKGMVFATSDCEQRVPKPVGGLRLVGDRLEWTATDDPAHCYYRVYCRGKQIASTVATHAKAPRDASLEDFAVVAVDRWGNCPSFVGNPVPTAGSST